MEKMTIHRALTELKTVGIRIDNTIREGVYITANKRSNTKINGVSVDDHRKVIQGSFDKVTALITRRNAIKAAVVASNAKTMVTVGGKTMTVADAIERKNSIAYDQVFLNALKTAYLQATAKVNKENEDLPKKLETYLSSALGNKNEANPSEVEVHIKTFTERNEFELIDPLQLRSKINAIEEEIENFLADVDAALSESNAVNFIFDEVV